MWGQVGILCSDFTPTGIIPTRVGTSPLTACMLRVLKDHPHACGDKIYNETCGRIAQGSSPRVWGQDPITVPNRPEPRIIPTRVGTSGAKSPKRLRKQDHPHACGDKEFIHITMQIVIGSSPRVWGQGYMVFVFVPAQLIIPTRVGTRPHLGKPTAST